jgi:two-component system response regulator ChvI
MTKPLVLIVEDEPAIRDNIQFALEGEGLSTLQLPTGGGVLELLGEHSVDLIVLDVGLPDISGFDLLKDIRKRHRTPVILLTARNAELDRVLGLEIGADDYLCKPFSMRELMARVKVLLRRASLVEGAGRQPEDRATAAGHLALDPLRLSAAWKGTPLPLTVTEFLLLSALARRPGVVKTRDQLMEEAYPDRVSVSDRTIDSHVKRIRRKLESIDRSFAGIEGVYGAGYRFIAHE